MIPLVISSDSVLAATLLATAILLPGYLALKIRDGLVETWRRPAKEAWLPALIFDLPIYLLLFGVSQISLFGLTPTLEAGKNFNPMTILAALCIACFVGLSAGWMENRRLIGPLLLWLGASPKGWRSTWANAFQYAESRGENWTVVELQDGSRYYGWPKFYSAEATNATVFLAEGPSGQPVTWIPYKGEREIPLPGPGILLPVGAKISRVYFLRG